MNALESLVNILFGSDSLLYGFVSANPIMSSIILFLIPLLIIGFVAIFFDFIVDVWKMPFAVAIDYSKYLAFSNEFYLLVTLVLSPVVFYGLVHKKNKTLAIFCTVLSALFTSIYFIPYLPDVFGLIVSLTPFNTALMFIACILD